MVKLLSADLFCMRRHVLSVFLQIAVDEMNCHLTSEMVCVIFSLCNLKFNSISFAILFFFLTIHTSRIRAKIVSYRFADKLSIDAFAFEASIFDASAFRIHKRNMWVKRSEVNVREYTYPLAISFTSVHS